MSDSSQPIEAKIAAWLETQGYPLEMRVARTFRDAGMAVLQSDYYADPEDGNLREMDVVATVDARCDDYVLRVSVVAECKASRDKPWTLFTGTSRGLAGPARVVQRISDGLGAMLLRSVSQRPEIQSVPIFGIHGRPAHGVTQAFTSGTDAAYAAIHGASKAAAARARMKGTSSQPFFQLMLPVVVVDGRLFDACIDESDELKVSEISEGTLLWRNPVSSLPHTVIDIVTLGAVPEYVARVLRSADTLFSATRSECLSAINAVRARSKPRTVSRGIEV